MLPAHRARSRRRSFAAVLAAGLGALTVGCSTPIASSLDEPEANRVMLALDRAHVAATKEVDATSEGKFRVTVANDDAARALAALRAEELPRAKATAGSDGNKGSLVPSPAAEHAQIAQAMASELERSLESVDGVLSARVHLNVPAPEVLTLREGPREKATASVLLAHRGTTPPLLENAVQRLVAGGVPGLAPADVAVVMVPRGPATQAGSDESGLARVGPFGVARSSLHAIQATFAAMLVLVAGLAGALVAMGARLARLRAAPEERGGAVGR